MKKFLLIAIICFSASQVFLSDFYIKQYEAASQSSPDLFYIPDSQYIRLFVLGYDNLAADIIFVKTVLYFADQFLGARDYAYLERLLYIVADLDPIFERAYLWGGSVLMYNGQWITKRSIEQSTKFLEYGWKKIKGYPEEYRHDGEYWRIPLMIGFNYAIELHDIKKGIPYIEEVSRIENAPSIYRTWVSTLYRKSGDEEKAARALERELIVENLKTTMKQNIDEGLKKDILGRLSKYYRDLYGKEAIQRRIQALMEEAARLNKAYVKDYPFIPVELFLIINTDLAKHDRYDPLDMIFYDGLF